MGSPALDISIALGKKDQGSVGEILFMNDILSKIIDNQATTLTPKVVSFFIANISQIYPATLSEALCSQNGEENINKIIVTLAKLRDNQQQRNDRLNLIYNHLDLILDYIARYSVAEPQAVAEPQGVIRSSTDRRGVSLQKQTGSNDEVAKRILHDLRSGGVVQATDLQLNGRAPAACRYRSRGAYAERQKAILELRAAYTPPRSYLEELSQDIRRPVRITLGRDLVSCIIESSNKPGPSLKREVLLSFDEHRSNIRKRFGVSPSGVLFVADDEEDPELALPPHTLRIEIAAEPMRDMPDVTVGEKNCFEGVMQVIAATWEKTRGMWLTADSVEEALEMLGGSSAAWLRERYSLTDLKLLLRAVLSSTSGEHPHAVDGVTLRDLPDLLGSLVFWTKACLVKGGQGLDGECLVDGLRATQAARFGGSKVAGSGGVNDLLADGIRALAEPNGAGKAAQLFEDAINKDSVAATKGFPHVFASGVPAGVGRWWEAYCSVTPGKVLRGKYVSDKVKQQIDDARETVGTANSAADLRHLRVCRLLSDDIKHIDQTEFASLLLAPPDLDWQTKDTAALAVLALAAYQKGRLQRPGQLEAAGQLLAKAFGEWGKNENRDDAEAAFSEAIDLCNAPEVRGPRWCWSVLDAAVAAYGKPNFIMDLQLGSLLWQRGNLNDVRHALELIARASAALDEVPQDDRDRTVAWLQYNHAGAQIALAQLGETQGLTEGKMLLSKVLDTQHDQGWPSAADVDRLRLRFALVTGDEATLESMLLSSQLDTDNFLGDRIGFLLSHGKLKQARSSVDELPEERPDRPFWLAVVQYLGRDPIAELEKSVREFTASGHEYADYTRLLLFVAATRETNDEAAAKAVRWVNERWAEIEPNVSTWNDRLLQGDMTP
jgi:hypothetical protein